MASAVGLTASQRSRTAYASARRASNRQSGLSLLEILFAAALFVILAGLASTMIDTALKAQRVENALETVKMQLQFAREYAMAQRRVHRVQLQPSREVVLDRLDGPSLWSPVSKIRLPDGVDYIIEPGTPTTGSGAPGGVASSQPVDFNGTTEVLFRPDGSAVDASGRICTGVVFLAKPGHPETVRAVTVFGPTGRIRTWRLRSQNGQSSWK